MSDINQTPGTPEQAPVQPAQRQVPPMLGASPAGVVPPIAPPDQPAETVPVPGAERLSSAADGLGVPFDVPNDEPAPKAADGGDEDIPADETQVQKYTPRGNSDHVEQEFPVFGPLTDPNDDSPQVVVPGEQQGVLAEAIGSYPLEERKRMIESDPFVRALAGGIYHSPEAEFYGDLSDRKGSKWKQVLAVGGRKLGVSRPNLNDDDAAVLKGPKAIMRMRSYLGLGGTYRIPLWNSGFWASINTPSEAALLELDRKLSEEKINLGRDTSGLLFSNASVFIVDHLTQFFIDHLHSTTLKNEDDLLEKLSIHDIQHFAWGLACSIWPNGFQYARAILGETPDKNRVVEGKINVSKLQWIDEACFTPWQLSHMANVTIGSMTDDAVKRYQDDFVMRKDHQITINENVRLNLAIPSVQEHLRSGRQWVNSIVTMTNRVFGMDQDENARNQYIDNQGKATILRQYGHWVKSIEMGNGLVTDLETIEDNLSLMSADDKTRNDIMNAVIKYAEDTTVAFIAVPTVDEREENQFPRMPHLLPLDALTTFFTLLRQKLPQILAR